MTAASSLPRRRKLCAWEHGSRTFCRAEGRGHRDVCNTLPGRVPREVACRKRHTHTPVCTSVHIHSAWKLPVLHPCSRRRVNVQKGPVPPAPVFFPKTYFEGVERGQIPPVFVALDFGSCDLLLRCSEGGVSGLALGRNPPFSGIRVRPLWPEHRGWCSPRPRTGLLGPSPWAESTGSLSGSSAWGGALDSAALLSSGRTGALAGTSMLGSAEPKLLGDACVSLGGVSWGPSPRPRSHPKAGLTAGSSWARPGHSGLPGVWLWDWHTGAWRWGRTCGPPERTRRGLVLRGL